MILNILLLAIILSLESSVGLPLFFLYLAYKKIIRYKEQTQVLLLLMMSLFLAIFYAIPWPLLTLLVFVFHFAWPIFKDKKFVWQLFIFALFNVIVFVLGKLQFNYFYLLHIPVFLFYVYKSNFKKYAG